MFLRACRLTYPVCHAPAPYCLLPPWLHHNCRYYLINGKIFRKMSLNVKCVFLFILQIVFETFLFLRRNQRSIGERLHVKWPLFLSDFNDIFIFSTEFRNVSKIKFYQNPSNGSRLVPCRQTDGHKRRRTDGHDETNSRFSQFCESA